MKRLLILVLLFWFFPLSPISANTISVASLEKLPKSWGPWEERAYWALSVYMMSAGADSELALELSEWSVYGYRDQTFPNALLTLAVIEVESNYRVTAVNPKTGAAGLGQIHPIHFQEEEIQRTIGLGEESLWDCGVGYIDNLFDPFSSFCVSHMFVSKFLDKHDGNIEKALADYNGALGNTKLAAPYINKVLSVYRKLLWLCDLIENTK